MAVVKGGDSHTFDLGEPGWSEMPPDMRIEIRDDKRGFHEALENILVQIFRHIDI